MHPNDTADRRGHTPGPWHRPHICDDDHPCNCLTICDEGRYASGVATVVVGNDLPIGEGGIDGPSKSEAAANARLIAAAPTLLAALQECQTILHDLVREPVFSIQVAYARGIEAEAKARAVLALATTPTQEP